MRVRLVPIGETLRRMPFVVRDLARESGKKVTLVEQAGASGFINKPVDKRRVLEVIRGVLEGRA